MSEGDSSPSAAMADITIDGGNSSMTVNGPGRTLNGARSVSPAKRSAADMEDGGEEKEQHTVPGSFKATVGQEDGASDFDTAMAGMDPQHSSTDPPHGTATSMKGFGGATSASSAPEQAQAFPDYSREELEEQVKKVRDACVKPLDVGQKGVVVSSKWLARVQSRTSEGQNNSEFPKHAREGLIGPVDNSELVPDGAFDGPFLHDMEKKAFIPLKPGLTMDNEYSVLPNAVWGDVVAWYGMKTGQHQISRYVQNTAEQEDASNLQYEMYPPVITIRKVPQPNQQTERPPTPPSRSADRLRLRLEQRSRGQSSPDDAARLVSSRTEQIQKLLARSKEAVGIAKSTKVRLWRHLDADKVASSRQGDRNGVATPPQSRDGSPSSTEPTKIKLVMTPAEFKGLELGKDIEHIDVTDQTNNDKYNGKSTLDLSGIVADQTILLEEQIGGPAGGEFESDSKKRSHFPANGKKAAGSKPGSATTSGRNSPAPGSMMTRGRTQRNGRTRGCIGLTNLGNTCYMNSALQCIRSVQELAIYFLTAQHKREINVDNPLGHHGNMAKAYATVLEGIYSTSAASAFNPNFFKRALGSAQPLFSGYGQQDSQEFLSFLVDALHEDLNRIIKKPYNENPDSDDKTVHDPQAIIDLGNIYRQNHKARNDSIAMDLFSGSYKNTMECPNCEKVSVTFDPFSLVTLQLPIDSSWQHSVAFIPLNGSPAKHDVELDKHATLRSLKESLASKHPGVSADRLWMAEVYNSKIFKVFDDRTTVSEAGIQNNDHIFVFELDNVPTNVPELKKSSLYSYNSKSEEVPDMDSTKSDTIAVPIFSRTKGRGYGFDFTLHPMYITVTRDEAQNYDIILKKVLVAVSRLTSRPILTEINGHETSKGKKLAVVNGNVEKEEFARDDTARVSDRSASSEDGYVEVTVTAPNSARSFDGKMSDSEVQSDSRQIPRNFMDPQYRLHETLRSSLFNMGYAESADGPFCASMNSIGNVRTMHDRVKQLARRTSIDSGSSEAPSASTGVATETEESDVGEDNDMLKPDIHLGEDSLSLPGSDDEAQNISTQFSLPDDPLESLTNRRNGRANKFNKKGKRGKGKNGKNKKGRVGKTPMPRPNSNASHQSFRSLSDNLFYIKTGEGIVLDWNPDAFNSLFNGDTGVADELRGHFLSSKDGKDLPIVDDPALTAKRKKREERKKSGVTLEDCFAETGKREILSQDNAWYCGRCKEMRQAAKTLEIWTIPDILIVHLKRFGGNRTFRDKIDVNVHYPIEGLDMSDRIGMKEAGKEYLYDLIAVDNHYGGLGGGHYTAIAKNFFDGQWYDYNDSSCSKIKDDRGLQSAAAYLLFYRRRSDKPLGPPKLQEIVLEYLNPPQPAEGTDEDESGEAKLGDPTSSLHGLPSDGGAGARAVSHRSTAAAATGVGASAADNPLTPSPTTTQQASDEDEPMDRRFVGPLLPGTTFASQREASWNFDTLDSIESPPVELEDTMNGDGNQAANADNDSTFGELGEEDQRDDVFMEEDSDIPSSAAGGGGFNSPIGHYGEYDGMQTEQSDPPATEIHLGSMGMNDKDSEAGRGGAMN